MHRNFIKNILLFILLCLQLNTNGAELSYREILDTAINNSFDLKMSALDISISKANLKAVRADWYPTLSMQFNTEYNKDLTDGQGTYAYAGNTMITPYTQYRDMLYLTASYNLLDYGIQGHKVHIAKQELAQKETNYNIQLKDLKLKILDLYCKAQQYNNTINTKSEILELYENMFHNKERMYKAGINNKLSVMDEAVKMAKTQSEVEGAKRELKNILEDLSYYTKTDYEIENLNFKRIENNIIDVGDIKIQEPTINKDIQLQNRIFFNKYITNESRYYDLEIDKKKSELSILKRQRLPIFRIYAGYALYGQNPNNYWHSIQDVGQRSFVVGLSSQYVFFDGFKNRANREKTKLEIEKLQIEKEKKLSELENRYTKTFKTYESYNEELNTNQMILSTVQSKLNDIGRLKVKKLIDENELLATKAELLTQEFELEQNIINITSKMEEMKIMAGDEL